MMLGLGLSLTSVPVLARGSGTPTPPATLTQPYNYHLYEIGDSRTAQGYTVSGTYGTSTGYTYDAGTGPAAMLGPLTGHKVRYASLVNNAGGAGQNVAQILAYPRSGTSTIDLTQVAANEAATVVMYMGTNAPDDLGPSGSARGLIENAIAALTDPTVAWTGTGSPLPLFGGQAKNVIVFNETPRGIDASDAAGQTITTDQAAEMEAWATWLMQFDFASGAAKANDRVVVIDTFHAPTILDTTSGASYLPLPGLFADGLHPAPQGVYRMDQVAAARLTGLLTNASPFAELPTTLTASANLIPNPVFTARGTGASIAVTAPNVTLSSALIPAGTTVLPFGTGGTTGTGGTGTYTLSAAATETGTAAALFSNGGRFYATTTAGSAVITITTAVSGATMAAGAAITGARLPTNVVLVASGESGQTLNIDVAINALGGDLGNEIVLHITGTTGTSGSNVTLYQNALTAALNTVDLSTAYLRQSVNIKYTIANPNTIVSVNPILLVQNGTAAQAFSANGPLEGRALGYANTLSKWLNLRNDYADLSGSTYLTYTTPTGTLSASLAGSPGIAAGTHPSTVRAQVTIVLQPSSTIDVTVSISQMGAMVVAD